MNAAANIGFMQGRLSPLVDGRIQAFPWDTWQQEFAIAAAHGFRLLEWTLDQDRLYENPLLTTSGQAQIRALCRRHDFAIPSLTGDCFMQAPFWKARGVDRDAGESDFLAIAKACAAVGISKMVVPLVDNGRIDGPAQEDALVAFLESHVGYLTEHAVQVAFECDFAPPALARFIGRLEPSVFGINYDIGNSAALGFDPTEEIAAYGRRIINVHVKDRLLGGTTVPLGTGNADFEIAFGALAQVEYSGTYILQTARATDGNHVEVLCRYRDMTADWLSSRAT
jgi:hexulose-6-phosphate isomerase